MKTISSFFICIFLFFGCAKKNDTASNNNNNNNNNVIPPPSSSVTNDTLSAGWTVTSSITAGNISDIFFINDLTGYIKRFPDSIYKSTDGGYTWVPTHERVTGDNITCTPDGKIFTLLDSFISVSTNAGTNFTRSSIPNKIFRDVFFPDNNNGYMVGTTIYHTIDGGLNWSPVQPLTGYVYSGNYSTLFFLNNTTGWIVSGQRIYYSNGSVNNWSQAIISGTTPSTDFYSVYAASANVIYAQTYSSEIFKSTDGGLHFSLIKILETGNSFSDIHFIDENNGYAAHGNRIYKTTDGGSTWQVVVALSPASDPIIEIHFTDAGHGWGCTYDGGRILAYR
ncbi:MAG: YCF48-related protein [Ferruginibacter sp.]